MIALPQVFLLIEATSIIVIGTIAVWVLLGFYSVRLFKTFRGGDLGLGWRYVCLAIPFLICGQLVTGIGAADSLSPSQESLLLATGALISLGGGITMVMGFRIQLKMWNPKGLDDQLSEARKMHEISGKVAT